MGNGEWRDGVRGAVHTCEWPLARCHHVGAALVAARPGSRRIKCRTESR